jgi:hypothetical protein
MGAVVLQMRDYELRRAAPRPVDGPGRVLRVTCAAWENPSLSERVDRVVAELGPRLDHMHAMWGAAAAVPFGGSVSADGRTCYVSAAVAADLSLDNSAMVAADLTEQSLMDFRESVRAMWADYRLAPPADVSPFMAYD